MFETVAHEDLLRAVREHDFDQTDEPFGGDLVDAITALEGLVRAAQATQIEMIQRLDSWRGGGSDASLSIIGEVGMARNISPGAASTQYETALALADLPQVMAAFTVGTISHETARAIARETLHLNADDALAVDGQLASHLGGITSGRAARLTRHAVIAIDPAAASERARTNRANAYITMSQEPDGIAWLHLRGPAEQIVAAHRCIDSYARGLHATGTDHRTIGQIAVDTAIERLTGLSHAHQVNVEVQLVMDAPTFLGHGDFPVDLIGFGPVAPDVADDLIARAPSATIRRLLVDPVDGTLMLREPRRRFFRGSLRGQVHMRDRDCRQPGCECRIADIDHVHEHHLDGPTTGANGQGLCDLSHTIKGLPGWSVDAKGKVTTWTTPTGHTYTSRPPPVLPRL